MKADTLTPRELFEGKVQFEIPSFQRPYVWTEEDQWAPLWEDVKRVARDVIEADGDAEKLKAHGAHFLGAIVVKDLGHQAGDVARSAVIVVLGGLRAFLLAASALVVSVYAVSLGFRR